jgi:hypothetical protein
MASVDSGFKKLLILVMRVKSRILAGEAGFGAWIEFSGAALFTVFPNAATCKSLRV